MEIRTSVVEATRSSVVRPITGTNLMLVVSSAIGKHTLP